MILNAWNGVWSDTYIVQIIIPEELEKLQRFCKKLDFKDIKFIVKVRDIHKTEKNNSIDISVFGYENKKYPICVSNNAFKRHIDLLLVVEEDKRHYVLTKYFNTCMYDHTYTTSTDLCKFWKYFSAKFKWVLYKQISKICCLQLCL